MLSPQFRKIGESAALEISAANFLAQWTFHDLPPPTIDVRSQGEFAKGSIPGSLNIPILTDGERHLVGTTFKTRGAAAARKLGEELVQPFRESRIDSWLKIASPLPLPVLFCWRGGLRSEIAQAWCRERSLDIVRIRGGYKSIRHELLEQFAKPIKGICIMGYTGTGKTELLHQCAKIASVLDLENLAQHRGSAFGILPQNKQPSVANFENAIAWELLRHHNHRAPQPLLFEDESSRIGALSIPTIFFQAISQQPGILIEDSLESRAQRIYSTYVIANIQIHGTAFTELFLKNSILKVSKRLGGARTHSFLQMITKAMRQKSPQAAKAHHVDWIQRLLRNYYDPRYEYSMQRRPRNIIFRGTAQEAFSFLSA